jgi:hypothetical protein
MSQSKVPGNANLKRILAKSIVSAKRKKTLQTWLDMVP